MTLAKTWLGRGSRGSKYFISRVTDVLFLGGAFLLFWAATAHASSVEDIKIQTLPDGYEISLNSLHSYQFRNVTPGGTGKKFYIQLKTRNFQNLSQEDVDDIHGNVISSWDRSTGLPLKELSFDGDDAENPRIALDFMEDVSVVVHSSADEKTIIIKVTTAAPPASVILESQKGTDIALPELAGASTQPEAPLMLEAKEALTKKDYDAAVQLYLKALLTAQEPLKQQAQELLGVARERNGQLAHAAAEYQKYLKDYSQSPEAARVRQRLIGVVNLSQGPQTGVKERLSTDQKLQAEQALWTSQYFGSVSQFFNWDATKFDGGRTRESVKNLSNDVDLNARFKSKDRDVSARFTGGFTQNYIQGEENESRISALSVQMNDKKNGFTAKVGRQTLSTGGVLGRFDGVHASQRLMPWMKLNIVAGFPVESVKNTYIQSQKAFVGTSIDWGAPKEKWNYNTYVITQRNAGLTDRTAIGTEVRYFDPTKAFFTLVDYDTYFKQVNIASFNGHWTFPSKTTINVSADHRKSPLITTNNAIIGMGVAKLSDLKDRFTRSELRQFALDRTADSDTFSVGFSQELRENLQWNGDVSISKMGGTVSSGGVDGTPATDPDYMYTTELIASSVLKDDDTLITGVGFTDSELSNEYSLSVNYRYPLTKKVRVNPRVRLAFRSQKDSSDSRVTFRPLMRVDIALTKSTTLEFEGGAEWVNETTLGEKHNSVECFMTAGYRFIF